MKQGYFEHDGIRYPSGTQIKILHYPYNNPIKSDLAYFMYYDTERGTVWYKMAFTGQNRGTSMQNFKEQFGGVTGKFSSAVHPPQRKRIKESQIPGMVLGWLWYIFIMAIATIFKGAIGIWIIASIVFFSWRRKKIEKEGYYIDF